MMKKLFLIDAYALIYKFYYAFIKNPMKSPQGENVSAVFGFVRFINEILLKEKPDMIGVAFDPKGGSFRNKIYPLYKANREATPEDIISSTPIIKEFLEAMNIPVLEVMNYEADDIIGTLSHKASMIEGLNTFMVTPDKDYAQLIKDNVVMYKPSSKKDEPSNIVNKQTIFEKYGFNDTKHIIDMLAIWGDASDNIPGVKSIGEKGAVALINKYGTVEQILENIDDLTDKHRNAIVQCKEELILSKILATISLDVPIDLNINELELKEANTEKLKELYSRLGFKSLLAQLGGNSGLNMVVEQKQSPQQHNLKYSVKSSLKTPKAKTIIDDGQQSLFDMLDGSDDIKTEHSKQGSNTATNINDSNTLSTIKLDTDDNTNSTTIQTIHNTTHKYITISTAKELKQLILHLEQSKLICFDTETTSLNPISAQLVGVSISIKEFEAYWIPWQTEYLNILKPLFKNNSIAKIGHNIKYDILVLKQYGIDVQGKLWDTMLMHYLLDAESRQSMNYLSNHLLGYEPIHIEELIGKGVKQITMDRADPEQVAIYAAEDADVTMRLFNHLMPLLKQQEKVELYDNVEEPIINILADMENEGIKIDVNTLQSERVELINKATEIEQKVSELIMTLTDSELSTKSVIPDMIPSPINLNSPKQLGILLFETLQLNTKAKLTKSGSYKTDEETLTQLIDKHPIVKEILNYRSIKKLLGTYIDALPQLINQKTGRIHTSYNQAVTSTGRLSSTNPNLQNIPIRDDNGRNIRKAFVPRSKEWKIVSADYSQIELRIMAHVSGDTNMLEAFRNREDIHSATASKIYGVTLNEVTREQRNKAKTANFGIIYGISAFGLSQRLSIPRLEAKELIDSYFIHFPDVKNYMDKVIQEARERGYVETIFGRRRYLKNIMSDNSIVRSYDERNAVNAPIQGSAADIMKLAMTKVYNAIREAGLKTKMLLQVHDEIVLEVPTIEVDRVEVLLKQEMSSATELMVELVTEVGIGDNWLEAH